MEKFCSRRRDSSVVPAKRSFTLVELIVVLTILFGVTGLGFPAAGYIQKKGARSRAESEMAALGAAVENYKSDNGNYPRDPETGGGNTCQSSTDKLSRIARAFRAATQQVTITNTPVAISTAS